MTGSTTRQHQPWQLPIGRYVQACRHLSVVQTAVASAKVTFALSLLSVHSVLVPIVGGLMAFAVYNANNLTDRDEDAVNCPGQAGFVVRHGRAIAGAATAAGAAALVLATVAGGPLGGLVVLSPAIAGVVYSTPALSFAGLGRLKDVFIANTALVAAAWAVPIATLPVVVAGEGSPLAVTVVCGYFFLRTFVSVEVFNVRDVAGDRATGVATLPTRLGSRATGRVLVGLDICSLALLVLAGPVVGLSSTAVMAAVPVTVLSVALTKAVTVTDADALFCLGKDGEYLVLGIAGLVAL